MPSETRGMQATVLVTHQVLHSLSVLKTLLHSQAFVQSLSDSLAYWRSGSILLLPMAAVGRGDARP